MGGGLWALVAAAINLHGDAAGYALIGACFVTVGLLAFQPVLSWVRLTESFLEVYNWPRLHDVRWTDISAVGERRSGVIAVTRRSARPLTLLGLSVPFGLPVSWNKSTVAEIEERIAIASA
jgi:hypothetical protein